MRRMWSNLSSGICTDKDRLNVYHEQTQPLIDYYTKAGILKTVDGTVDINDVFAAIVEILGA